MDYYGFVGDCLNIGYTPKTPVYSNRHNDD